MERGRIPNRLKRYRRIAGYSQKKVAKLMGLADTSSISRWEHGISCPNLVQAFRLSRIYNVLPHELYAELWNDNQSIADLLAHFEPIDSHESFLT